MRLSKMKEIIASNMNAIKLVAHPINPQHTLYAIPGLYSMRLAAINLSEVAALKEASLLLLSSLPVVKDDSALSNVSSEVFTTINQRNQKLVNLLHLSNSILEQTVKDPSEGTVYFKLPDEINVSSFRKDIEIIDKSFSQLFSGHELAPNIQLMGVDSGSMWLVLKIGSGLNIFLNVMKEIIGIANETTKLKHEILKMKGTEANTELIKATTELIKSMTETNNMKTQYLKAKLSQGLAEEYGSLNTPGSPEEISKFTKSIDSLANLFEKGADIEIPLITKKLDAETSAKLELESKKLIDSKKETLLLETPKKPNEEPSEGS